jgi:ubiquinone/menaquinone biosynthesis C-methylase UbiE
MRVEHVPPQTPAPFDTAAEFYDREFETSPGVERLRKITLVTALRHFPAGAKILELNCGTGTDAIVLAKHGCSVLATDGSAAMLGLAKRKVSDQSLSDAVSFLHLPFERLAELRGRSFQGAFSNFGGLNCAADLRTVARELSLVLPPGAIFVMCLLSDFSLWETITFLLRGRFRAALRRRSSRAVPVHVHGTDVPVYFYSPSQVARAFSPFFSITSITGLNIFTPPPASRNAYHRIRHLRRALEAVDDRVCELYPFHRMGDHALFVLERNDD